MRLTDFELEKCSKAEIKSHQAFKETHYRQYTEEEFNALYFEGVTFILGLHPDGRFAHWEDTIYATTEHGMIEYQGAYHVCGSDQWAVEFSKENIEANAKKSFSISPDYFLAIFIGSNICGEGTPIYVDRVNC